MDKAPDALRTIGEVAEGLDVPHHVLRFWETRFPAIKPLKRSGGRRYYRPEDVALVTGVRRLLYDQGYTIKGVQRILRERGQRHVQAIGRGEAAAPPPAPEEAEAQAPLLAASDPTDAGPKREARVPGEARVDAVARLEAVLQDLTSCRALLRASEAATPALASSDGDGEPIAPD